MSVQYAVDNIGRTEAAAKHYALVMMAHHLKREHGWGRRRIAAALGTTERWVKEYTS